MRQVRAGSPSRPKLLAFLGPNRWRDTSQSDVPRRTFPGKVCDRQVLPRCLVDVSGPRISKDSTIW